MPQFVDYLEGQLSSKLANLIIEQLSIHLSTIMKKVDLRGLIEEQINTFDLDYIEKLIIEIANKELKLIMSLGFILGGIIGFFQGLVAIFV
ncbi:membrane associated protein [Staphylococcus aureus]|nr:membrane associated protein [Staphylococcus aureus]CXM08012.1 membrane associated protein [Staphylococcus aureus]CXR15913.1 membrane associated protein [Staphylococcus aureus]CXY89190.1 membrane associated protein [Staphylococcus aureus]